MTSSTHCPKALNKERTLTSNFLHRAVAFLYKRQDVKAEVFDCLSSAGLKLDPSDGRLTISDRHGGGAPSETGTLRLSVESQS